MNSIPAWRVVLALAGAALAGCAPTTAAGVRALGPERAYVFEAPENYQAVYRKVLERSRTCFQVGALTAQMVVQGDLYHDIRSGTITVALHGGLGIDTYRVVDITAHDDARTKVVGHFVRDPVERSGAILKEWVLENSMECGLQSGSDAPR